MARRLGGLVAAFVSLSLTGVHAEPPMLMPSITMDVSPGSGSLDDRFVISVQISMSESQVLDSYSPPRFEGFNIVDEDRRRSFSREVQGGVELANRVVLHFRYTLAPEREGILRIAGAKARVSGNDVHTAARAVQIQSPLTQWLGADSSEKQSPVRLQVADILGHEFSTLLDDSTVSRPDVFIHAAANKERPFVGEQVTVIWLIYSRYELVELKPEMPRTDDFWSEILFEPINPKRLPDQFVNDTRYKVALISKRALFPLHPGKITLEPYRAQVATLTSALGEMIDVHSQPLTFEVQPLPVLAPRGFDSRYVGVFDIRTSVVSERVVLGEPFILTVEVNVEGAVRPMSTPRIQAPGFSIEAPQEVSQTSHSTGDRVLGKRTYQYWLTPTQTGTWTVAPGPIDYFNPRTASYEVALAESHELEVVDIHQSEHSPATRLDGPPPSATRREDDTSSAWPRWLRPWWRSLVIAVGICVVFLSIRSFRARDTSGDVRILHTHLGAAERYLDRHDINSFFAELTWILEHSLNTRLDVQIRSMTHEQVARTLQHHGVPASMVEQIQQLFVMCELARFASSTVTSDEMTHALQQTRKLSRDIQTLEINTSNDP